MNALPPLPADDLEHVLNHTREGWEAMRGKQLFITGGTGFFGRWLLESFVRADEQLKLGASATILSRNPDAFRTSMPHVAAHESVKLTTGDMCTCKMEGERFDFAIHAAVEPLLPNPDADPLALFERNVAGTKNVLELARCCGARRFLLTSSGAVYGRQPPELSHVNEDYAGAPDPLDPLTTYGQAKRTSEFVCAAYGRKYGLEVVVARCFAFVGPHLQLDAGYAIGNFIRDALRGGPVRVAGDGTPRRSYLYAADLAVWLWTILFRGQTGRAYNVGSDADLSVQELADEVRDVVAPPAEVKVAKRPVPGTQAERYVPSIRRARTELGLDVWVSRQDAIARTAAWHRGTPTQAV